jgi:hypothetical protein
MATSMTAPQLRGLARLYRRRVDGAADVLASIIANNAHELPDVLGFPMQNLERLRDHENPVEVLVATIEAAPRVARDLRDKIWHETATAIAVRVAQTAQRRNGGHYGLDLELLGEALTRYPGRIITFGTWGSCGSLRLRAILRETRGLRATSVVLTDTQVVVAYEGERCRGLIKLALHEPVVDEGALIVPIEMRMTDELAHAADAAERQNAWQPPEPAKPDDEVDRTPEPDRRSPHEVPSRHEDAPGGVLVRGSVPAPRETVLGQRRGSVIRPTEPFRRAALRFVEALAAAALGGGP